VAAATSASKNRSTKPRNQPLDSSLSRRASSPLSSAPPPLFHSGGAGVVVSAAAAAVAPGPVLAFPFAGDIRDLGDGDDFVGVAAAAAGFDDSSTTTTASGEETVAGTGLRLYRPKADRSVARAALTHDVARLWRSAATAAGEGDGGPEQEQERRRASAGAEQRASGAAAAVEDGECHCSASLLEPVG